MATKSELWDQVVSLVTAGASVTPEPPAPVDSLAVFVRAPQGSPSGWMTSPDEQEAIARACAGITWAGDPASCNPDWAWGEVEKIKAVNKIGDTQGFDAGMKAYKALPYWELPPRVACYLLLTGVIQPYAFVSLGSQVHAYAIFPSIDSFLTEQISRHLNPGTPGTM